MDELLTEDQQAERVRRWVRENGLFVVAGVVLGLGGLFGWQQWNDYQVQQSGEASNVWEQMRQAIDGERFNAAQETLTVLESDYAVTPYLAQGRLAMARMHMDRNELGAAAEQLQLAVSDTRDPTLRRVAELRLAQLYIAEQRYAEAQELLGPDDDSSFAALYHELRGDALFYQGEYAAARTAYEQALATDISGVIDRPYVQIKRDDVAAKLAASAPATATAPATPATDNTAAP